MLVNSDLCFLVFLLLRAYGWNRRMGISKAIEVQPCLRRSSESRNKFQREKWKPNFSAEENPKMCQNSFSSQIKGDINDGKHLSTWYLEELLLLNDEGKSLFQPPFIQTNITWKNDRHSCNQLLFVYNFVVSKCTRLNEEML